MLQGDIVMPKDKDPTDPAHYNNLAIQPRDYITKNNLGYNEGNIIKYISRWQSKGGLTDLKKAKNYIDNPGRRTQPAKGRKAETR